MNEDRKKYNKRKRLYHKRPEVKEKINARNKKRYQEDSKFREQRKKTNTKWQKKHQLGLGEPDRIREICEGIGISKEIAELIALDGEALDKRLKKVVDDANKMHEMREKKKSSTKQPCQIQHK